MRDISARELKGHNILAVERFWDSTRWMTAMKCGCFLQRTAIRPPYSARNAGKLKSGGMPVSSRAMSSTSSRASAAATHK